MSLQSLSSRAVIGEFYHQLETGAGSLAWPAAISMLINSDQESETYRWLGMPPVMREWVGGRHAKGLRDSGIQILNTPYEATLEFPTEWLRRDKTGQAQVRINELAARTNAHWAKLLSTLINNGDAANAYDAQYFFDTDHAEGDSGTQSNSLSVDISALTCTSHGTTTAPSACEMAQVVMQCIQAVLGFKDDQGEPMNEEAMSFLCMVPTSLYLPAIAGLGARVIDSGDDNPVMLARTDGFNIALAANPRSDWTAELAVFRVDGSAAPLIRQEEMAPTMTAQAEGSDAEFSDRVHRYGLEAWRGVGYGYWQYACKATMT